MFNLPEPLHPAVVHFPIVLILIGAAVACTAVFFPRWHLPWIAAVLLALGGIGTYIAVETGESEEETAGKLPPVAEQLLDAHEDWAERTLVVAGIAAALAIAAAGFGTGIARKTRGESAGLAPAPEAVSPARSDATRTTRLSIIATGARAAAAVLALVACFFIYQTSHRGGELVYRHGVGVMTSPAAAPASESHGQKKSKH